MMDLSPKPGQLPQLPWPQQLLFVFISFILVAFGQPAWSSFLASLAAFCGFALFWRVLLDYSNPWKRFWIATGWFGAVQMVQLAWALSHPYLYIYPIYLLASFLFAVQFGLIGMWIHYKALTRFLHFLGIASLWTILEWSRLSILSGLSWNPVGLTLTANIFSLQMASIWGIFGLSFWVILTNLFALRAWSRRWSLPSIALWSAAALAPYSYGGLQLSLHANALEEHAKEPQNQFKAIVVNTTFPAEESLDFSKPNALTSYALHEWKEMLKGMKQHHGKPADLILFPECIVPFGTYSAVFKFDDVRALFEKTLGDESLKAFPQSHPPYGRKINEDLLVNNAFIAQTLANYFGAGVVVGLEDAADVDGKREFYSAAMYFEPQAKALPQRYEKRVLVPLGEYIPFEFCRAIAAEYGVQGSFTFGKEAKVFKSRDIPFGVSICYEETLGDVMRENKPLGAAVLVNLTSDAWYPDSLLAQQHLDLARLRTVENGFSLVRSCNMGISGAVDSLGRTIEVTRHPKDLPKGSAEAIYFEVPTYTYATLYTRFGDTLILGCCIFVLIAAIIWKPR